MKKILFFIIPIILINCSSQKVQYWCGDHACKNEKERLKYFRETLIVEHKIVKKKDKNLQKSYAEILKDKKYKKVKTKKDKFNIKKGKKAKIVKLPKNEIETKKIKKKQVAKQLNKIESKNSKKVANIPEIINKDFENIVDNVINKSTKQKYPDINNFPE